VKVCYESKLKASTINKTDLGKEFEWQKFRTADQVNETYLLYGELNDITADGFTVDFDPKKVTSEDFKRQIQAMAKPMLLHPATRSILISFTAYSV